MIQSFADKATEDLYRRRPGKKLRAIYEKAMEKLAQLNAAAVLADLRVPPGNRLEPLKGDRKGQHSIRINRQYRVCFRWTPEGPHDVEVNKHYE